MEYKYKYNASRCCTYTERSVKELQLFFVLDSAGYVLCGDGSIKGHDLYLTYLGRSLDLDYYITLLHPLISHLVRFMKYST